MCMKPLPITPIPLSGWCSFDAAGGASAEANNLAVAQLAGLEAADVIMGEWSNSVMRPCHYLAADKANHCIILAIRCTPHHAPASCSCALLYTDV